MVKKTLKTIHFHYKYLAAAKRFIRLNYNKNLTLKLIAKNAGVSEFHFARMFMAYTQESPFQYIKKVRVKEALLMMEDDEKLSITEIALSVGYETPSAFNKVFKELLKMSPREFRNIGKEEKFKFIYDLGMNPNQKENPMNLNLKHELSLCREEWYF
jgi:AraC-like DNA-binding protein